MNSKLLGVAGIIVILGIATSLSTNRRAIRLRIVGAAFALQAFVAWLVLYTSWGRAGIETLSGVVGDLLGYATKGTEFLFGPSEANPLAHSFAIAACNANAAPTTLSRIALRFVDSAKAMPRITMIPATPSSF